MRRYIEGLIDSIMTDLFCCPSEINSINTLPITWGATHRIRNPFFTSPSTGSNSFKDSSMPKKSFVEDDRNFIENMEVFKTPYTTSIDYQLAVNFEHILSLKPPTKDEITDRMVNLPPAAGAKKTLIMDLDGTMITSIAYEDYLNLSEEQKSQYQITTVSSRNDTRFNVAFCVRPHLDEFLASASQDYDIIVFSAGTEEYVSNLVDKLDPEHQYITAILTREFCVRSNETDYIKDLRIIENRRLEQMVIVDDMPISFSNQMENGICIPTYKGEEEDDELLKILKFLLSIRNTKDVRPSIEKFSGVKQLLKLYKNEQTELDKY